MRFEKAILRRSFLERSLTAAAALGFPSVVPARVFGPSAPNNLIQVGQIGCGRIARVSEFPGILRNSDVARYVAVCDLDSIRLADAKSMLEQAYAKKFGAGNYAELKTYGDYREMLQDKSIDAVAISTPDHWHSQIAMEAALAGKDIYLQKPASLTVKEGRQMADTLKRTGRIFQQGSQQRSDYNFRTACELIRNGRIGKIQQARDRRGSKVRGDALVLPIAVARRFRPFRPLQFPGHRMRVGLGGLAAGFRFGERALRGRRQRLAFRGRREPWANNRSSVILRVLSHAALPISNPGARGSYLNCKIMKPILIFGIFACHRCFSLAMAYLLR